MEKIKRYFSGLSRNTFLLAISSIFSDIATEMLYPIIPVYLTQTLNSGGSIVGIIEGLAGATQNIVQGFSGWLSDKIQRRKSIALIGYTLAALSKPLIGLSTSWQEVLGARFLDRFGTGTRSAPRDALIASSVEEKNRGKAFGLEGAGDNLGAFLGPLIAIVLLFYIGVPIKNIFFFAVIPGLLAVTMIALVKEKKIHIEAPSKIDANLGKFPKIYWKYLFVTALFGIGNSSNAFLILQTRSIGIPLITTIFIYAFFNLIASLVSYPSGTLSDKYGRKNLLLGCFIIFLTTYAGFAFSTNIFLIGFSFILYGIFQGIFRAVGKACAVDFVPSHLKASGIGWYSTTVGLSGLTASVIAGQLWDKVSHPAVFIYGICFALVGTISLVILIPSKTQE